MRANRVFHFAAVFFVCAFVMLGVVSDGSAGYRPDNDFLENMEVLLRNAPTAISGERYLRVGETYQEGDVVDFIEGYRMHLQEWRLIHEGEYAGNFRVRFWVCWPDRAKSWSVILSPEGQLMNDFESGNPEDGFNERDIPADSSEAIEKSEKIQKLLRTLF